MIQRHFQVGDRVEEGVDKGQMVFKVNQLAW